MPDTSLSQRVDAVRRFNRFYTKQIGVLNQGLLRSPFSLTEVRVLYELAHSDRPAASEVAKALGLDAGYLSRILRDFEERRLIERAPSEADARLSHVWLTKRGQKAFAALDVRSNTEIGDMLLQLSDAEQRRLIDSMRNIQRLLGDESLAARPSKAPYLVRQHQPGDMGWVVQRHGVLYAEEYGWDERFEALVARIVADFIENYDPRRERCWMAERDGEIVGSVFLVKHPDRPKRVARLRLLLVEPSARGLGLGKRLVDECVRFARQAGYGEMTLWTHTVLHAARHIYEQAGFELVREEAHNAFGQDVVGQTWELPL
ncbi:MAG: bifunctional helix-turn-helix transcriptional regulator/GNAT family N-acetyltransferase [Gemmatimonadaceae bacterium]